jgi:NAD(P)-dependent dehydrogenase (short-subunit alcohol dehydrogenase family)
MRFGYDGRIEQKEIDISQRLAVVTGGHKGLGPEVCRQLAGIQDMKGVLSCGNGRALPSRSKGDPAAR